MCETDAKDPSVFSKIDNRLRVGSHDQNLKIQAQGEKKKQESCDPDHIKLSALMKLLQLPTALYRKRASHADTGRCALL